MNEETLFQEALFRPPEERQAFLKQSCTGRPELLATVLALLATHEKSGNIFDRPTVDNMGSGPDPVWPGTTCDHAPGSDGSSSPVTRTTDYPRKSESGLVIAGRYTLQEKIGEGGMGEVWVASQTEPVKRKVALKLIKTGMDSKAVLQRFEQERQALAMMDHPNIARVLDGGLTPTGQPFFVMELVDGLPLSKFCDEARLTTEERLELFVPICQAVQHAHLKGIVHRDLKPANILVAAIDGKPVPKVIDFGVAKAIAGTLTELPISTQFGAVIGTLEYMSPEQAGFSGVDIDTRADIYSLGVILYELLTGLRPIDAKRLRTAAVTELIRMIKEEEPSKPSTRLSTGDSLASLAALRQTEPRKLMALLRGELDWVVMNCLEKQRDRRYQTAAALARDIQLYLSDEPVEARPPSAGYRFGKFLRRNRGPVLAASLVLLVLVGGIVGTTIGMFRADRLRVEADDARRHEAERAAGERLAREKEAEQRANAEQARDRTRWALDAMSSSVTGDSFTTPKEISDEQKMFLAEALAYYQEFVGEKAHDEPSRARTAAAAFRVGFIEFRLGRTVAAATAWRMAIDAYTNLVAEFPAAPEHRTDLAQSQNTLGQLLATLGQPSEAQELYRKALAIEEKLVADLENPS
jgi:serine/threonine protein kinase